MSLWDKARAEVERNKIPQLPVCDWVYFATPTPASFEQTRTLVGEFGMIIRTVINTAGIAIANVGQLRVGDKILLVHGSGGAYRPMLSCIVIAPIHPVDEFEACSFTDAVQEARLELSGYPRDPHYKRFTGIMVDPGRNLDARLPLVAKPTGNTTLRRWEEVFSAPAGR